MWLVYCGCGCGFVLIAYCYWCLGLVLFVWLVDLDALMVLVISALCLVSVWGYLVFGLLC